MIFSFQRPSHIAISDEKGGVRGISDERGNVRGYREGDDKTRVQLLVDAIKYYFVLMAIKNIKIIKKERQYDFRFYQGIV